MNVRSSVVVAAKAIEEACVTIRELPYVAEVRALHARLAAFRSVLVGLVKRRPTITEAQRERVTEDALALAEEVARVRRRLAPPRDLARTTRRGRRRSRPLE